jgi:hypothetical protein
MNVTQCGQLEDLFKMSPTSVLSFIYIPSMSWYVRGRVESVSGRNPAARRRTRGSTLRALPTWSLPRDASRKSRSSKKNQAPQGNPTHGPPPCKSELVKFAGQTPLTVTPGGRTYCRQPNYTFNDDSMQLFCKSLCVPFALQLLCGLREWVYRHFLWQTEEKAMLSQLLG